MKNATKFFDFTDFAKMAEFVKGLGLRTQAEIEKVNYYSSACNGVDVVYPAQLPLEKREVEVGYNDFEGRATFKTVTFDALGGIVEVA